MPELFNPFTLALLVGLILFFHLDLVTAFLNIRALPETPPPALKDAWDDERYAQCREYIGVTEGFSLRKAAFQLGVFLGFWLLGGFAWSLNLARDLDLPIWCQDLVFFGILYGLNWLAILPFDLYETFGIEERFGFNQMTWRTWLSDQAKGILFLLFLGAPLVVLVMWIFRSVPMAWIVAWAVVSAFSLILAWAAPKWILPVFNKFTPMEEGPLKQKIESLAKSCGFPGVEVYLMDGSKRSGKANAFFTGFGKTKRIALFDTLVESLTEEEILSVLAHEIGHWRKGHIPRMIGINLMQNALFFGVLGWAVESSQFAKAFGLSTPDLALSLVSAMIFWDLVGRVFGIFSSWLSRKHEFEADAYASQATGGGSALISALKKLADKNFAHPSPHWFEVALHHSHPPMIERFQALEQHDTSLAGR